MVLADRDQSNRASARTVRISDTEWVADVAATSFLSGSNSVTARFQPTVNLMRNGQRRQMANWDTALDGSNPILRSVQVTFTRTAGGGAAGGPRVPADALPLPNLLPQWVSSNRPLLRVLGTGRNNTREVAMGFCAGVGQDQVAVVDVPALIWGASVVSANVGRAVRVELRSSATVIEAFETTAPMRANANAQTRQNYRDRPARIRVANVVQSLVADYGRRGGFFDRALIANDPLGSVDRPNLCIVVDSDNRVDEGPNGERDNQLCIG